MVSSSPHKFMALRDFEALVYSTDGMPDSTPAMYGPGLLTLSKLPLVREVLDDMGYDNEAPVLIKGNNVFYIGLRLTIEVFRRLESKLEDIAVASQFRNDLHEVSLQLGLFVPYTGPLCKKSSISTQASDSGHNSNLVFSSGSSDDEIVADDPCRASIDSYHSASRFSQSLSGSEYKTTTREHGWKTASHSVEPKVWNAGTKHMGEPHGCRPNSVQKKRLHNGDAHEASGERAAHKKLCHRDPSLSTPTPPFVHHIHNPWGAAESRLHRISADDETRPRVLLRLSKALLTIQTAVGSDGFEIFKQIWVASDHTPMIVRQKDIIWPAYLAGRELPALRRYQEALVDRIIAGETACYFYYHLLGHHYRYLAKAEIFLAYNIGRVKPHLQPNRELDGEARIPNEQYWSALADFGQPVQVGARFEQQKLKWRGPDPHASSVYEKFSLNLDILDTAYGKGFFAFLSSPPTNMLAQYHPSEIQQAVDAIAGDRALHIGIKKASAEAYRLMQVRKNTGHTGYESLDHLKSLMAKLR